MAKETDAMKELVPVRIRSSANRKEDFVTMINGKVFRIKIGVPVMVPRYVAEAIDASLDAQDSIEQMISGMEQ